MAFDFTNRRTLCLFALILLAGSAGTPAVAGSWETVKEFYGSVTIIYTIDHKAELDDTTFILKKNGMASLQVTGNSCDGANYWSEGLITGALTTESRLISSDGSAIVGTFSGSFDGEFGQGKRSGPGLRVNKEEGLYTISLPSVYAVGTATNTVPVLGTVTEDGAEDEIHPHVPVPYGRGGVTYDPESRSIIGSYTNTEEFPHISHAIKVTVMVSWSFSFDLPPLKADAGGPYTVERGQKVMLDASGSSGRITEYHWTFAPAGDCPAETDLRGGEREDCTTEVVVLCPMTVTLIVSDGTDEDIDTASVEVTARDWETDFHHEPGEVKLTDGGAPWYDPREGVSKYRGGENICAVEDSTQEYHNFHPPRSGDSWEGSGYELQLVRDPKGPFDGFWYLSSYDLEIRRATAINPYLLPEADPLWGAAKNFHTENVERGADMAGYLDAIRDHEMEHSRRKELALADHDPAKKIEDRFTRDRDELKGEVDGIIRKAEKAICIQSSDPLPETWRGKLWFPNINTGIYQGPATVYVGGSRGYGAVTVCP